MRTLKQAPPLVLVTRSGALNVEIIDLVSPRSRDAQEPREAIAKGSIYNNY